MKYKYNPKEFSWDVEIEKSMEIIYGYCEKEHLTKEEKFFQEKEVGDLHFLLKHAVVDCLLKKETADEIEEYFWGLLK